MWLWGIEGQGVWRGEVFVWQRHRQWGGGAGEGGVQGVRARGVFCADGVWRGEVRECGTGEGQGGKEWAVWRGGRAWEGRGVKREEEWWGERAGNKKPPVRESRRLWCRR